MTLQVSDVHVALLGNVGPGSPEFSTENEYRRAYESHDIQIDCFPEHNVDSWRDLIKLVKSSDQPSFIQWTSTHGVRRLLPSDVQEDLFKACMKHDVPVVGVHLDRFWGIREREKWISDDDPYFRCDILLTADGGSDDRWDDAGIEHVWLPPAVGERWCHKGKVRSEYESDVAFVGSWYRYHREAKHRAQLISWLQRHYPKARMWPSRREPAIRGDDLTDLYWSTGVVVGDSFFHSSRSSSQPHPFYSSDRIPESLGRGAMLLHPATEGVTDPDGVFGAAPNLSTWKAFQWSSLKREIDAVLELPKATVTRRRNAGIKFIREYHTYERRVVEMIKILEDRKVVI